VPPETPFDVPVDVMNRTDAPQTVGLDPALMDAFGDSTPLPPQTLVLSPRATRRLQIRASASRNGVYKIRAEVAVPGRRFVRDLGGFCVWPAPDHPPDPHSFFGWHVNAWYGGAFIRQAARLGVAWVRAHDMLQATWWYRVQRRPGPFDWEGDTQIRPVREAGLSILGELFGTPP